jgi:hypothetical protein
MLPLMATRTNTRMRLRVMATLTAVLRRRPGVRTGNASARGARTARTPPTLACDPQDIATVTLMRNAQTPDTGTRTIISNDAYLGISFQFLACLVERPVCSFRCSSAFTGTKRGRKGGGGGGEGGGHLLAC